MKREEAIELAEAGYTELCRALQAGQSETLTRYLKVMATFHRYSFGNVMMIFRQFPKARQVAGFRAWER